MSLILEAVRHKPIGLFQLDDTSPLQDYSQYNRVATYTGTPAKHAALVKGATYAPVFKTGAIATFECPVFVQGKELDSFSLAATVSVVMSGANAPIQILGHTGQYDGLTIDGTVVSFSTKYLSTGTSKCSYDLQTLKAADVVGVHTRAKNLLYVNGELVAEANITEVQRADSYIATDGNLYSGQTTGGRGIAVNAIAYYDKALTQDDVTALHTAARDVPSSNGVAPMYGGERLSLSRESSDIFAQSSWKTTEDWYSAQMSGATVNNGQLVPQFSSGVSLPSKWFDNFVLDSAGTTSIYGVTLDWEGEGANVDVSLDGTTWTAASKGVNVSIIPSGFNPTNKELLIRISFPGGITDDTSYVSNLVATGIRTAVSPTWSGRTLTFANAFQQQPAEALDFNSLWGAKVNNGGTITITPDTGAQGVVARTIELWIRADDSSAAVNVSGTYYQNGIAASSTLPIGIWTLYHIVAAANVTTNIVISGAAQVGQVAVYPTALNATQIADVAAAYAGANPLKVGDISPIAVSEVAGSAQIYAYNWSILSSG